MADRGTADDVADLRPVVVLVAPQLGGNIGAAARAMLNCSLGELRLVAPRDGWPSVSAQAMATGASRAVIERALVYETTAEAVADLHRVYATTARRRDLLKPTLDLRGLATELVAAAAKNERAGVLFGPERAGLDNHDVTLASHLVHIPLNPDYASLNLAQAVLLVAHAWFEQSPAGAVAPPGPMSSTPAATSAQMVNLFGHLEQELEDAGFLRVVEKRDIMVRNLRSILQRAELREHEVRALHGVISSLVGRRKDGAPVRQPSVESKDEASRQERAPGR